MHDKSDGARDEILLDSRLVFPPRFNFGTVVYLQLVVAGALSDIILVY